ncbi:MAG: DUF4421 family protein [Chryseotalea sp.]
MRKLLLLCFLFIFQFSFAQSDIEIVWQDADDSIKHYKKQAHDSVRRKFVKGYPDKFFIWPVIKRRTLEVEARSIENNKHRIFLKPNNAISLGVGVYLFEIALELAFTAPVDEQSKVRLGTSDASDLQINALGKFWGFDLYHQRYKGFYLEDSFDPVAKTDPFPQRPDIVTRNFGFSGIYTLNRDKFSLRSSFNFAEQQLYSRGSWFITGTLNNFKIEGDSVLLSIKDREQFSEFAGFDRLRYTTFGLAPGYSHNFIYKNFFLNLTLGIGPAHNWTTIRSITGKERNSVSINSISVLRIGVGYNADNFFAGVGYVNQSRNLKIEDFRFTNTTAMFKLLIGWRFKEFGILKKRAVDLIPFQI